MNCTVQTGAPGAGEAGAARGVSGEGDDGGDGGSNLADRGSSRAGHGAGGQMAAGAPVGDGEAMTGTATGEAGRMALTSMRAGNGGGDWGGDGDGGGDKGWN